MPSIRQLYLDHVAQTSGLSMMLEIDRAEGVFIYDTSGKRYFDMNSGIAVSSIGHCHPKVVEAIRNQAERHLHTMVYGEHIHQPQVRFANRLCAELDESLSSVYYLMSGTEATELAMKIGKKYTGRQEIVACRHAYHGSTQGAESLRSDEDYKSAFYPLLPDIRHMDFNQVEDLEMITEKTACVIIEPVQGEAGVILPKVGYLEAVQQKCKEVGALFILDEIQTGFGRTGHLFAHQKYGVIPDVLLIGKAMGGGMPIAGVVASKQILSCLTKNPELGHITTFGGHPLSCAAADASLEVLLATDLIEEVAEKEQKIHQLLNHEIVHEIRSSGLMMAVELTRKKYLKHVVGYCFDHGLLIDWFLFNNKSFRLAPPLIITMQEVEEACGIIRDALDYAQAKY